MICPREEIRHEDFGFRTCECRASRLLSSIIKGRWTSKKKHLSAKKEKRLEKHGYFAKKGKFGYVKGTPKKSKQTKRKALTIGGSRKKR